jgi:hypothetical protein
MCHPLSLNPRYAADVQFYLRWGAAELEPHRPDLALPVLAGDRRATTLTPVGEPPYSCSPPGALKAPM